MPSETDCQSWWNNLSADWQKSLLRGASLHKEGPDFAPSDAHLQQIVEIQVLEMYVGSERTIDVTPAAALKNLNELSFSGYKKLEGLENLAALPSLQTLSIINCNMSDLGFIEGLQALRTLNLNSNGITSVEKLAHLGELTELEISDNRIEDATPISSLTALEKLDLGENRLSSFDFAAGLTNLEELSLAKSTATELMPLAGLTNLRVLNLAAEFAEGKITDLTPLAGLTNLEQLDISSHEVGDASVLANFQKLRRLRCVGISKDLTGIKGLQLPNLEEIHGAKSFKRSELTAFKKTHPSVDFS